MKYNLKYLHSVITLIAAGLVCISCADKARFKTEHKAVNLDFKIGQMLMVGFRGLDVNENSPIARDIRERHLGGVVLFDYDVPTKSPVRNIASPGQLKKLTAKLQSFSDIPLLIAIDEEGGKVSRLKERFGFAGTVSAEYLGKINDLPLTRKYASQIAKSLAKAGINMNFAPVVDLNINPENPVIGRLERSFSADPNIVVNNAVEFINAHHDEGVMCVLKHFPGHGSGSADSHLGLVDVTNTWSQTELIPYEQIIRMNKVDAIMTAHIFNAKLDANYPATLSRKIITALLRDKLNYDGTVISDDMQMRAIAANYGFETAIENAINAGVDVILIANNSSYDENITEKAVATIKSLIKQGKISKTRINESFARLIKLKSKTVKQ